MKEPTTPVRFVQQMSTDGIMKPRRRRTLVSKGAIIQQDKDDEYGIEVISEHAGDSLDFLSEQLTTERDEMS